MTAPTVARPSYLTDAERLLLRAAVLPEDAGRSAYREWRAGRDLQTLDESAYRLLPLLSDNLRRIGLTDPDNQRLRGIARYAWYSNQRALRAGGEAVRLMAKLGVTPVALKGAALIAGERMAASARPMTDVDLLVPPERFDDVLAAMVAAGWRWVHPWPEPTARLVNHSAAVVTGDGQQVDLHWAPLWEPGVLGDLADHAAPGQLLGADVLLPCDADHIVLIACHGLGWHLTRLRWIPDLATLVQGADEATWQRVLEVAVRDRVSRIVGHALATLRDAVGIAPPPALLETLQRAPAPMIDRVSGLTRARRPRGHWMLFAAEYSARSRRDPRRARAISPVRYTQLYWNLPNRRALLRQLGHKARQLLLTGRSDPPTAAATTPAGQPVDQLGRPGSS